MLPPPKLPVLTLEVFLKEAATFAREECTHYEPTLYGVDNGKTVGTYLEKKFRAYVDQRFQVAPGSSASGIDFPGLNIDIKTTSWKQPQSSCPFKSARQKIFGLGYSILAFVYDKTDDDAKRTATLDIRHAVFIEAAATADWTMTRRLREMLSDGANQEDIVAFLVDKNLPVDEIEANNLALELLNGEPPAQGYLTISNALQWRLNYGHAIDAAGVAAGVYRLRGEK